MAPSLDEYTGGVYKEPTPAEDGTEFLTQNVTPLQKLNFLTAEREMTKMTDGYIVGKAFFLGVIFGAFLGLVAGWWFFYKGGI